MLKDWIDAGRGVCAPCTASGASRRQLPQPATLMSSTAEESRTARLAGSLRVAEKLTIGFFTYITVAAFLFPLALRQRLALVALNLLAGAVTFLLGRWGRKECSPFLAVVRDWLPSVLILLAYRESGLFFRPDPANRLDQLFVRWDDALLKNPGVLSLLTHCSPWLQRYLELAYLLCYPSVPLALGSLYLARQIAPGFWLAKPALDERVFDRRYGLAVNQFWTAALLAAFSCFVLFPFFPLTPPRELFHDFAGPQVAPLLRGLNHWILGRYAVGASLFPSAHVATVTAMALVVRAYLPRVGIAFLILAGSIALATVYGRYHYAADALAGILVGIAAFLISCYIHKS
jgi:membrane-associated phospholipid phosphatase